MEEWSLLKRLMWQHIGGFVLAFHEISPERFVGLIESLGPLRPIHLGELVQRAGRRKSNDGLFAITVDDGVGDTVRGLAKVLEVKGWPATFYLPTRYVETGESIAFQWWRKLEPLLPRGVVNLSSGTLDLSDRQAIDRLAKRMQALWYTRPQQEYVPFTMELVAALVASGVDRAAIQPPRPITWAEVATLGKSGLIRFESHAVTHTAVCALSEEELVFEMKHSRDVITEHSGRLCRHLAYPYGGHESIGSAARSIAQRYYDSATTMMLGAVDGADPWLLPRIPFYSSTSNWFARLKVLLKCSNINAAGANTEDAVGQVSVKQ